MTSYYRFITVHYLASHRSDWHQEQWFMQLKVPDGSLRTIPAQISIIWLYLLVFQINWVCRLRSQQNKSSLVSATWVVDTSACQTVHTVTLVQKSFIFVSFRPNYEHDCKQWDRTNSPRREPVPRHLLNASLVIKMATAYYLIVMLVCVL